MAGKYDCDPERWSFRRIDALYPKIFLDESFQRKGGWERGSGWSKKNSSSYLESAISEGVTNSIILANIDECLSHANRIGNQESVEYFKERQSAGHKYVSIDGNNTSSTIAHFMMGKIKTSGGKFFSDYHETKREEIAHEEKIQVYIYRKITLPEMTAKFRSVNKSTKLNDQEARQARCTELAKYIREVSN